MQLEPVLARPQWIRVKAPSSERVTRLQQIIHQSRLNTVCSSAACPNMGECWNNGTATFMILGNQCTRACRFCNVQSKLKPAPVDLDEPRRLVDLVIAMALKHVVITSVARDDLDCGGSKQFARILKLLRADAPQMTTEVLVPDFLGSIENLKTVVDERPNIFNHNLETVQRLTKRVRSKAIYERSLSVLKNAKELCPKIITKSGLMLGLGEEDDEVVEALKDLRAHDCDHLTLGQYLRPSPKHHPVMRYVTPEKFFELKRVAKDLGFLHVESGPLVRSSYHAEKGVRATASES